MHETANVFTLIQITRGQDKRKVQKSLHYYLLWEKENRRNILARHLHVLYYYC